MTTTTQDKTQAEPVQAEPATPVLGDVSVSRHDHTTVFRWGLGHGVGPVRALTVTGMQRALQATADYLGELSAGERGALAGVAGAPHFRVTPGLWEIAAVPGHGPQVAELMAAVVNADGSLGRAGQE
jgi:hypothetical protein